MRIAILCAFVMLDVRTTTSSMDTEHRQLRMVNRLTEATKTVIKPAVKATVPKKKPVLKTGIEVKVGVKKPVSKESGSPVAPKAKVTAKVGATAPKTPSTKVMVGKVGIKIGGAVKKPVVKQMGNLHIGGAVIKPVPKEMGSPVAPKAKVTAKAP